MKLIRTSNISFVPATTGFTGLPVQSGLVADFDAANDIAVGDNGFTSWKNQKGDQYITRQSNSIAYSPANPSFNNKPTLNTETGEFSFVNLPVTFTEITIVVVGRRAANARDGMLWALQGADGSTNDTYDLWNPGNEENKLGINNFSDNCLGPLVYGNLNNAFVSTIQLTSNNISLAKQYFNGEDKTGETTGTADSKVLQSRFHLGGCNQGYNWRGEYARVLVYDRRLTEQELSVLHPYLMNTYFPAIEDM